MRLAQPDDGWLARQLQISGRRVIGTHPPAPRMEGPWALPLSPEAQIALRWRAAVELPRRLNLLAMLVQRLGAWEELLRVTESEMRRAS